MRLKDHHNQFAWWVFKSQRGLSIIWVVLVIALTATALFDLMNLQTISLRQQSQSAIPYQAEMAEKNIASILGNTTAWIDTISDHENSYAFTCLRGGSCVGKSGPVYSIRDGINQQYYDWSNHNGISSQGTPCSTFATTAAGGDDSCPIQIQVTWQAICQGSCTCASVQPQITVKAIYHPGIQTQIAFNPENYTSTFNIPAGGGNCL